MIDFSSLYDEHIDNMFAFGSRFTTDRELIKDCIQDVFVKMYTKRDSLDMVENIERYLYVSLRNRINDEFRRNSHLCDNEITDKNTKALVEADVYNAEMTELEQIQTANMEKFFDKLSPRQREIIRLYYMEQRKYDDICEIMGINYQSVRNLMHRSITRLRYYASQTNTAN